MKLVGDIFLNTTTLKNIKLKANNYDYLFAHHYSVYGNRICVVDLSSYINISNKNREDYNNIIKTIIKSTNKKKDLPEQVMFIELLNPCDDPSVNFQYDMTIFNINSNFVQKFRSDKQYFPEEEIITKANNCINGAGAVYKYLVNMLLYTTKKPIDIYMEDNLRMKFEYNSDGSPVINVLDVNHRGNFTLGILDNLCDRVRSNDIVSPARFDKSLNTFNLNYVNCGNDHLIIETDTILSDEVMQEIKDGIIKKISYISNVIDDYDTTYLIQENQLNKSILQGVKFNISFISEIINGRKSCSPEKETKHNYFINTYEAGVEKTSACGSAVVSSIMYLRKKWFDFLKYDVIKELDLNFTVENPSRVVGKYASSLNYSYEYNSTKEFIYHPIDDLKICIEKVDYVGSSFLDDTDPYANIRI